MITVSHLYKHYTQPDGTLVQALNDVSFHVSKGEVISVIGPSGSGKSTLLRTLNLLDPPSSGSIVVEGDDITKPRYPLSLLRQRMGMVFQQFNLFPHLTVKDNIKLALTKVRGLSAHEAEERAREMLAKVSLLEKAHAMPSALSGGQQQRTAIARCLAMQPDIILFDEPTSSLDPTMVGEVQGVMRLLAKEGMTMIVVSHNMKFAHDIATRTFFMHNGRLLEEGSPDEIFAHPRHEVTRAFVQRIRSLVFDIGSRSFDFYDMMSQIRQFSIRYGLPERMNNITHIVEEMLLLLAHYNSPVHIEVNHSELSGNTSVVFLHQGESLSPLERDDADELAVMIIKGMSKHIDTQQTPEGVRLTFNL